MDGKDQATRTDKATRVILAKPRTLFRAFLDAEALACWRGPDGMEVEVRDLDPRTGGGYRMVLRYQGDDRHKHGKSRPGEDEVAVRFVELLADEKIVEEVRFCSDDPAFARPMILTTTLVPDRDGTRVTFLAQDVPDSIRPEDHAEGMAASLRNLARLTE